MIFLLFSACFFESHANGTRMVHFYYIINLEARQYDFQILAGFFLCISSKNMLYYEGEPVSIDNGTDLKAKYCK